VATLYGITFLFRSAKDLVPNSSASYHSFATVFDIGVIPFYVFIALLFNQENNADPNSSKRWTTLFGTDTATNDVLFATVVLAIANGGIHAFCVVMDLYLAIMYRKIAALPPDLNPLEDRLKLTRRRFKHKHKNSEIVHVTFDEKRMSDLSATSTNESRMSKASTMVSSPDRQSKAISFTQSRAGANTTFSPHTPQSARISQQLMYQHQNSGVSRMDLHGRQSVVDAEYSKRMSPMPSNPISPKRNSVVSSLHSWEKGSANGNDENENPDLKRQSREEMQSDNWFVASDEVSESTEYPGRQQQQQQYGHKHSNSQNNYVPPSPSKHISPLRMNPPTPPPQPISARLASQTIADQSSHMNMPFQGAYSEQDEDLDSDRTKTMMSAVSAITASSQYSTASEFASHPTTSHSNHTAQTSWTNEGANPKGKYFGDLASAMRGLRPASEANAQQQGYHEVHTATSASPSRTARVEHNIVHPRPKSMVGSLHYADSEVSWASRNNGAGRYGVHQQQQQFQHQGREDYLNSVSGTVVRKNYGREDRQGRVVSRTGVDFETEEDEAGDFNMRGNGGRIRGRDVSGKIAEEGRGGAWGNWIRRGG
jgi:hypothetical protein